MSSFLIFYPDKLLWSSWNGFSFMSISLLRSGGIRFSCIVLRFIKKTLFACQVIKRRIDLTSKAFLFIVANLLQVNSLMIVIGEITHCQV